MAGRVIHSKLEGLSLLWDGINYSGQWDHRPRQPCPAAKKDGAAGGFIQLAVEESLRLCFRCLSVPQQSEHPCASWSGRS